MKKNIIILIAALMTLSASAYAAQTTIATSALTEDTKPAKKKKGEVKGVK